MSLFADRRRVAWLASAAAAGLIAGQITTCRLEFWQSMFVLGAIPGILQGLVLWRSRPFLLVRWVALTQLGVITTFMFTIPAFFGVGWLVSIVVPADLPSESGPSLIGWLVFGTPFFIGGVGLGGLQVTGFPRQQRRVRWVVATMLGSVAVAPIALTLVGMGDCRGTFGLPNQLVGLIGGSLYGVVTALALPPRTDT